MLRTVQPRSKRPTKSNNNKNNDNNNHNAEIMDQSKKSGFKEYTFILPSWVVLETSLLESIPASCILGAFVAFIDQDWIWNRDEVPKFFISSEQYYSIIYVSCGRYKNNYMMSYNY